MSWDGSRTEIRFNQRISELIEEKRDHLERNYRGPTNFFEQKLEEEDTLSLQEKIEREKRQIQERYRELKQLLREKSERDLEDKKEKLERKKEKLLEAQNSDIKTVEEFREQKKDQYREMGYDPEGEDSDMLERAVKSFKEDQPDVEQLQEEVEALEEEVQELQPESISLDTEADFLEN